MLRGIVLAALGEIGGALDRIEQGAEERDGQLLFVKVDPRLDPLRGEPRYVAVLQRMGLQT